MASVTDTPRTQDSDVVARVAPTTAPSATPTCCGRSTSTSGTASSSPCSGAAAAASRRCCAASPASTRRRAGEVEVYGRTAVAFQEPRLLPWRRVHENVALALLNGPEREEPPRARRRDPERGRPDRQARRLAAASCPAARPSGCRWPARW